MESRQRTTRGRPGLSNWAPVAERVRSLMAGPTSPTLEEVARHFDHAIREAAEAPRRRFDDSDLKPSTLRRFLAALAFVERFENEVAEEYIDTARALRNVPVAAVELIGRWSAYDWAAAVDAAVELVKGTYTVEKLRQLEKEARSKTSSHFLSGRQYAHQLRLRLRSWGQQHFGSDYELSKTIGRDEPPVDILYRRKSDGRRAGLMIFGPYRDDNMYKVRKSEFLSLVLGVSLMFERVVAIVPDFGQRERDHYWRWLARNRVARPNVEFFSRRPFSLANLQPILLYRPSEIVAE
jgi:hypothetical protein